jgi:hypothetical protein
MCTGNRLCVCNTNEDSRGRQELKEITSRDNALRSGKQKRHRGQGKKGSLSIRRGLIGKTNRTLAQ